MKTTTDFSSPTALLLTFSLLVYVANPAIAADYTWDTISGDSLVTGGAGTWDTTLNNWTKDNGATNLAWSNDNPAHKAIFGGANGIVNVTGTHDVNAIQFGANYTISGGSLNLAGANPTISHTTSFPVISSVLTGSSGVSTVGTGFSALYFEGANTYSGVTNVNSGFLVARHSSALGNAADGTLVTSGATLQLESNTGINIANEPLTIAGFGVNGNRGALASWSGTNEYGGPISMAAASSIMINSGDLRLPGSLSGTGNLTKIGGGSLTIAGSTNTGISGNWILDQGTLQFGKTGGAYAATSNITMGAGNTNQPNLRMLADQQFAPGVALNFINNAGNWVRFDLQGTTQTLAGIQNTTGGGVVQNERFGGGGTTGPATLVLNGSGTYNFNGYFRDRDLGSGTYLTNLTKEGTGTQALSGPNISYTGDTLVNEGTLRLVDARNAVAAKSIGQNGNLEINSTVAFLTRWNHPGAITGSGTLTKTGTGVFGITGTISLSGQINIAAGRIHNDNVTGNWTNNTASMDISSGAVLDLRANDVYVDKLTGSGEVWNSHPAGGGDTLHVGVANGSSTFSGRILGNASQAPDTPNGAATSLHKAGLGTFTSTGDNDYAGTTTVSAGTLQMGNGGTGGNLGAGAVTNNGTLIINRSAPTTIRGMSGTGSLTKDGTGTLTLSAPSTAMGDTTIANGTLQLGASTTAPTGAAIWYDATDGSSINTSGGGAVTSLTNKGTLGAAGNATAAVGQEPTFVAGEPAMNNLPVIRFEAGAGGGAPFDRLTNSTNYAAGNVSIFYSGRYSGPDYQRIVAGVNNNWLMGTWNNNSESAYFNNGFLANGVTPDMTSRVYGATISGTGVGTFSVNGITKGGGTGGQGPNGISLGGGYSGNPVTEFSDADIGEFLLFTSVLTPEQQRATEDYLSRKWRGVGTENVLAPSTKVHLTSATAKLDLNGTTQTLAGLSGVSGAEVKFGGGKLTLNTATDTVFAGNMTGDGELIKQGAGKLDLTGTNAFSNVTIEVGTLAVNGTTNVLGMTVKNGGTLGGTGSITSMAGVVTLETGSLLSPGNSPGTLTLDLNGGSLDISQAVTGSASLVFELGSLSDQVLLQNGTMLTIGSGVLDFADFTFTSVSGFTPGNYPLFVADVAVDGTLGTNLSGLVNGLPSTLGLGNGNKTLFLTVVPEPSASTSMLLAAFTLLATRKRSRRS
jgi:fibronectin-binding autotransporter adhesin